MQFLVQTRVDLHNELLILYVLLIVEGAIQFREQLNSTIAA